ncbi:MAG: hypothetical protein QW701_04590 [Candidatus Nezhaarchaeales archaeon]
MARKVGVEELERNPKLWFKPYCRTCELLFDDYEEYIDHCAKHHWRFKPT